MNTQNLQDTHYDTSEQKEQKLDKEFNGHSKKIRDYSNKRQTMPTRDERSSSFDRNESAFSEQITPKYQTPPELQPTSTLTKIIVSFFTGFCCCAIFIYFVGDLEKANIEKAQQVKINERIDAAFNRGYMKCQIEAFKAGVIKPEPNSIVPNQFPQFRFLMPNETPQIPSKEAIEKLPIIEAR